MKARTWLSGLVLAIALLAGTDRSLAQNRDMTAQGTSAKLWHVQWTTWLAMPFMEGDSSVAGSSVSLELSPSDIYDAADTVIGGQGRLEIWHRNKLGFIVESMGSLIEAEQTITATPTLPALPAIGAKVDFTWELVLVDIESAYRIYEGQWGTTGSRWLLDVTSGIRFTHFKQEADLNGLGPLGLSGTIGGTEDWVEPIIGARVGLMIDEHWGVGIRGNVGGFGIDGASDLSWRAAAGVSYKINERMTLKAGYQAYGLDFDNGESGRGQIGFDGIIHGPVIGMTWTF